MDVPGTNIYMRKVISFITGLMLIAVLSGILSGCIWGTAAVVGVAVVGANVEEFRESQAPRNATEDLDLHLEHKRKVDEAIRNASSGACDPIDTDEVIETYGGRILTD